ncbi:winged helix-turn-helix transcriptional regulator [Streptomyces zagrosensis]|uniref:DNA-binding HxlR family transcriptional regulator n=1 Tax=Streptomyces zagrosensis TaxID=1042984 RepID=A0A7W9QH50_9ACTN|nr:helix-turn-helix domain-containing protein [Streptomyces zagrosensis]MBB5940056.1 DNA-binding HxlR family transcriptional regulator [Streptomyces zagrosensis]
METIPDLRSYGGADAYLRNCASREVLDFLSSKWVCLTIGALRPGTMRFSELRRRLDGITQKMLTQSLRDCERNGLVLRTVYPTVPPRVEYRLTDLGQSLAGLTDAIRIWSESHMSDIQVAQGEYDERAARAPEPV